MSLYTRTYVMQSVQLASQRAATAARADMSRGVESLALISATAGLVGFLGTVLGIMNSFQSMGTSRTTAMVAVAGRLSQAMAPGILGLLVAMLAFWFHQYLSNELEAFDLQTKNASVDLVNRLVFHLERLRNADPPLWAALVIGSERPAVDAKPHADIALDGPRLSPERMHRHGVLELVWPHLESEFDVKTILDAAGRLCFAYGILGWFTYWLQYRFATAFTILAFFAGAGLAVRRGSRVALVAACSFLSVTAVSLIFSHAFILEPLCLLAAPLLLNGSWRAAQWSTHASRMRRKLMAVWTPLPIALAISASVAVVFGTLFGLFLTGTYDNSMQPTILERDWVIGVNASIAGPIRRGEVWQVNWVESGAVRVVGLPGDRVRITNGVLILNGEPVREGYRDAYSEPSGDFPLPSHAYSNEGLLRAYHELAYRMDLSGRNKLRRSSRARILFSTTTDRHYPTAAQWDP